MEHSAVQSGTIALYLRRLRPPKGHNSLGLWIVWEVLRWFCELSSRPEAKVGLVLFGSVRFPPRTQQWRLPARHALGSALASGLSLLRIAPVSSGARTWTWTDRTGVFPRLLLWNGGWVTTYAVIPRTVWVQRSVRRVRAGVNDAGSNGGFSNTIGRESGIAIPEPLTGIHWTECGDSRRKAARGQSTGGR